MADPVVAAAGGCYGMRLRKAMTTSPTTAKAVAAIMACS
jgi:hypothetical protein